jgi:hypothetical protein
LLWTRRRSTDDFAREIQSHIDLEADRLVEQAMTPADAPVSAQRAFGHPARVQEQF